MQMGLCEAGDHEHHVIPPWGGEEGCFQELRRAGRFLSTTEALVNKTWAQSRGKINGEWLGDSKSQACVLWTLLCCTALLPLTTCAQPVFFILSPGGSARDK